MENKRKHLEFIQAIISRMASNLFFLRGWTITLIGALLALFSKNNSPDQKNHGETHDKTTYKLVFRIKEFKAHGRTKIF